MTHMTTRQATLAALAVTLSVILAGCGLLPTADETTSDREEATEEAVAETTLNDDQGQESDPLAEQSAALDAFVLAGQAEVEGLVDSFGDTYSTIEFLAVYPDTIEYAYTYLEPIDPALATPAFDEQLPTFQDLCDTTLIPLMEQAGVTVGPKVRYTYYNPDGSLVWTHTFEKS